MRLSRPLRYQDSRLPSLCSVRDEALRRLWILTKQEVPDSHRQNESAAKALKSLASYSLYKAVEINLSVAHFAASIAEEANAFDGTFSPLDIVDELMEREGEENESVGMKLIMSSFGLNHELVKPVREICFGVIEKCLSSSSMKTACRAFKSVEPLINGFLTKFGRVQSETELKWQRGERERALLILQKRLEAGNIPLPLARQIKATLQPLFNRTRNENTQTNISHVLAGLPDTPMLDIFDAFCTGPWEYRGAIGTAEDIQRENQNNRESSISATQRLASIYPVIGDRIRVVGDFFTQSKQCEIKTSGADDFFFYLCQDRAFLLETSSMIAADSLPQELFPIVPVVFTALREQVQEEYLRVGKIAAGSNNPNILFGIAHAVRAGLFKSALESDRVLLDLLQERGDDRIQDILIQALGKIGRFAQYRTYAVDCLLNTKITNRSVADNVCDCFTYGNIDLDGLTSEEFGKLLNLLVELPRLNEYGQGHHIGLVLRWGTQNRTDKFLEFLLLRIKEGERRRTRKDWSYKIVPETDSNLMLAEINSSPYAPPFLATVVDYIINGSCIADELSSLFWEIASPGEFVFKLLTPFLKRDNKSCEAVIRMITRSPRAMSIEYPIFVTECLEAANQFGDAVLDSALMQFTLNAFPLKTGEKQLDPLPSHHLLARLYKQIMQRSEDTKMRPDFHFEQEESEF